MERDREGGRRSQGKGGKRECRLGLGGLDLFCGVRGVLWGVWLGGGGGVEGQGGEVEGGEVFGGCACCLSRV